jgi:inorganic pyrophosphatase
MDLFDIGQDVGYTGQVKQVKILGALAVNDVSLHIRPSW